MLFTAVLPPLTVLPIAHQVHGVTQSLYFYATVMLS